MNFSLLRNLQRHTGDAHSEEQKLRCEEPCTFTTPRLDTLARHQASKLCNRGQYYICPECGENVFNAVKFNAHKKRYMCKRYTCDLCDHRESSVAKLRKHKDDNHRVM